MSTKPGIHHACRLRHTSGAGDVVGRRAIAAEADPSRLKGVRLEVGRTGNAKEAVGSRTPKDVAIRFSGTRVTASHGARLEPIGRRRAVNADVGRLRCVRRATDARGLARGSPNIKAACQKSAAARGQRARPATTETGLWRVRKTWRDRAARRRDVFGTELSRC